MIYDVVHRTTYRYASAVDVSYHTLRLSPRELPYQRVLRSAVIATPAPLRVVDRVDWFGNKVSHISLEEPHDELVVDARSVGDVAYPPPPDAAKTPWWGSVRDALDGGGWPVEWAVSEVTRDSRMALIDDPIRQYAAPSFPKARPIFACVLDLNSRIKRDFAFDPRATGVATPVEQVMRLRRGVCQDFAHVMIACLRAMGLAARYVSGYVRTYPPPGQKRRIGADASHAWVSVWVPGADWVDVDPTNDLVVKDEHVVVGWGRDYSDISPIRGVILGGGAHELDVSVDLAPRAPEEVPA
ncbi:MAG: transglutaminase family protein [Alphaproteobacteria bacterium]|nr:transglutaminase family protein [Alphaproteobacteria bacterium]